VPATIWPKLLPDSCVALDTTPSVCAHAAAGVIFAVDPDDVEEQMRARTASFECRALSQSYGPSARAAPVLWDELVNEHDDVVIRVLVMPLAAMPSALTTALHEGPVAGPIPAWISDADVHYRSLKHIRKGFVVSVTGHFTKDAIVKFAENVELDAVAVNHLLRARN
jgi:hypothetical protein